MSNIDDVIVAAIGLLAAIVGGKAATSRINKKNRLSGNIKQSGIGNVNNTANLTQNSDNNDNEKK
jgi:hypothetical protein